MNERKEGRKGEMKQEMRKRKRITIKLCATQTKGMQYRLIAIAILRPC